MISKLKLTGLILLLIILILFFGSAQNNCLNFDGTYDLVQATTFTGVTNNFPCEFQAYPTAAIAISSKYIPDITGISKKRYTIFPNWNGTPVNAATGLYMGTNGIYVFEQTDSYMSALKFMVIDKTMDEFAKMRLNMNY